jgi:hypothetical protein
VGSLHFLFVSCPIVFLCLVVFPLKITFMDL